MLFSDLISELPVVRVSGPGDTDVESIVYDSRQAEAGSLFIAVKGEDFDGHEFAAAAVRNGAVAIIAERDLSHVLESGVSVAIVDDSRAAMASVAAKFYNYPSRKLELTGVTGTKGKTTTTHLITAALEAAGRKAGLIGTLGARIGNEAVPTVHTTPESVDVQRLLARMVDCGVRSVAMEVSSHGLAQRRVGGCEFDCGVFTNLTREHLDYHVTMESYLDAKLLLFREYGQASAKEFTAVINLDDVAAPRVVGAVKGRLITYAVKTAADITASDIQASGNSVTYLLRWGSESAHIRLRLGGLFNVYNSLAAAGAAIAQGVLLSQIAEGFQSVEGVAGRFESIECGQSFTVLVDYAHAPDALENVLRSARQLTPGRLIVAFGCGGNRDRGKRPIMGRIAAELADVCVVTSDNPRKEDPDAIIQEILAGIEKPFGERVIVEPDRREAIRAALGSASDDDVVIIAGKGHEDYQIFADRTVHFDDREVVREILCAMQGNYGKR